jgi:hypothetical protein
VANIDVHSVPRHRSGVVAASVHLGCRSLESRDSRYRVDGVRRSPRRRSRLEEKVRELKAVRT